MARPENFCVEQVINYLQGTCKTIQEAVNSLHPEMDEDDLSEDDLSEIDDEIFLCSDCGWWFELCEERTNDDCERTCSECCDDCDDCD